MRSPLADVQPAIMGPTASTDVVRRRVFFVLGFLALTYAFFAGFRTVSDFDLGWQMATGRWIVQHHSIPSVDVLSYTFAGQPWIYPVGAGLIFYVAYLLGGYGLISWIVAAACVATIALLLRKNTACAAAVAILAVPVISLRVLPRADLFSVVLFAALISVLWEQHRTSGARLWLIPLLMFAWVNLHLGFIAGLGLIAAYAVTEALDLIIPAERAAAIQRLRRAAPWLAAGVLATLVNPWGWGIYRAILLQRQVEKEHVYLLAEWVKLPLTWSAIASSFSLRQASGAIYILLAIAVVAAAFALVRRQLGAAIMLLGASYIAARYVRLGAVFACVVVVVGGPVLSEILARLGLQTNISRMRSAAAVAVAALAILVAVRCYDLGTNRYYLLGSSNGTFGAGLSWWFPERAAQFIQEHDLPGEVFNSYDEGGFLSWSLGPERRVAIDGRDPLYGVQAMEHNSKLLQSSPDSPLWQAEAVRHDVNTIILPLGRYNGIETVRLQAFCNSVLWKPVYLDEVSAVFVRRAAPQSEQLLQRYGVNCATAALPAERPQQRNAEAFNTGLNAGAVLGALGRYYEALDATGKALAIFPDSSFAHWLRGSLLFAMGRPGEAEGELRTAIALEPGDVTWAALSDFYRAQGRKAEAIGAMQHAAALSTRPYAFQSRLGYLYLSANQPKDALRAFAEAERSAPAGLHSAENGTFDVMVAQGRSLACVQLGDMARATSYQEQAAQIAPNSPEPWRRLAKLYQDQGRGNDAVKAQMKAAAAEEKQAN